MKFQLLGPFQLGQCTVPGTVSGEHNRALLAMLLLNAGHLVPAGDIAAELWPHEAGRVHPNTLHAQVTRLRHTLRKHLQPQAPIPLHSRSSGYILDIDPDDLDVTQFHRLRTAGLTRPEQEPARAIGKLRDALELWRGRALQDAVIGRRCRAAAASLDEARLRAQEQLAQLRMRVEDPATLVSDLKELVHLHPMRETLLALLMNALRGAGRRTEAVKTYLQARAHFVEELGVEPGEVVQREYLQILKED